MAKFANKNFHGMKTEATQVVEVKPSVQHKGPLTTLLSTPQKIYKRTVHVFVRKK